MRRFAAALLVPLAACAVLAGCSSSSAPASANAAVTVSGTFDKAPTVATPAQGLRREENHRPSLADAS